MTSSSHPMIAPIPSNWVMNFYRAEPDLGINRMTPDQRLHVFNTVINNPKIVTKEVLDRIIIDYDLDLVVDGENEDPVYLCLPQYAEADNGINVDAECLAVEEVMEFHESRNTEFTDEETLYIFICVVTGKADFSKEMLNDFLHSKGINGMLIVNAVTEA